MESYGRNGRRRGEGGSVNTKRLMVSFKGPLDAMGGPFKVNAAGRAIYICCPGCAKRIASYPEKYLRVLKEQGVDAPLIR